MPLRRASPFTWVLPYLETVVALVSGQEDPDVVAEHATAALEAAMAPGETLA